MCPNTNVSEHATESGGEPNVPKDVTDDPGEPNPKDVTEHPGESKCVQS